MAEFISLQVEKREAVGKAHVEKLRHLEKPKVPGVVYGQGADPLPVQLLEKELAKVLSTGHQLVRIDPGTGSTPAWIKEVQWDTYGDRILHIDFLRINADQEMEAEVTLEFAGVEDVAGVFQPLRITAPVIGKVAELPDQIRVVVSKMRPGDQLTLADLELPEGIRAAGDPRLTIANVQTSKAQAAAEAEAEAAGEAATAAPGVAPEEGKAEEKKEGESS